MKWLSNTLLWLWQLPQNFIAFTICGCMGHLCYYGGEFKGKTIYYSEYILSSFSLGTYIFLVPYYIDNTLKHEYGHSIQSQFLGWLYIPVIAIPSLLHNAYCRIMSAFGRKINYYNFYTEKWANNLANSRL